jgi:hypothetical protein
MHRILSRSLRRVFSARTIRPAGKTSTPRRSRRLWAPEGLEDRVLLSATIYTVNAITDTGAGSGTTGGLLYCIDQANANPNAAGSVIEFDPTVFATPQTITLSSTLTLSETAGPEVISGPGASLVTVSGNNSVGVFSVSSGVTATLAGLTISGGSAYMGGGIYNQGMLTVSNSTLTSNSAYYSGTPIVGGIYYFGGGGGMFNAGTVDVSNSTIADNSSAADGAGIWNQGTLDVSSSTIADNTTSFVGAGIANAGSADVSSSTIADNTAGFGGGGILNFDTATCSDSTIANNSATVGGGIYNQGPLTVSDSTLADNAVSGYAGGLLDDDATTSLDNTIVALNTMGSGSGATPSDITLVYGGVVSFSSAYNLIGTGGAGGLVNGVNGNQVGVADPGLGTLANNGGPTQTIALLTGSPAIDAGSNALAVDPTTGLPLLYDQRGPGYARIVNGTVDIGAFEVQPTTQLVVTAQPPAAVTAGSDFGLTVTAEDRSGNVDTSFTGTVTVALANNPGGGRLGGTLTATAQDGVATFSDLTLDQAGSGYTLLVSASGVSGATTSAFNVTPAAATQLVVSSQSPSEVAAGVVFGLTVAAEDPYGNVNPGFGGSVTVALSSNPGGATLGGTLIVTAQDGVATFSDLTLNKAGTGYTLLVSADGLVSATTDAFNVVTPTIYTVDATTDTGAGSGTTGDLLYCINEANANPSVAGSVIEFDPTVFATPQTIVLSSTLTLSETAGPEVVNGPGANLLTVSGNNSVEVFAIANGVTATITGQTISNGSAAYGGGIDNAGTLTVTDSTVADNEAGEGGGIYNVGTLSVTSSTIDDNAASSGGGISNAGTLNVTNSTIADNAAKGAGIVTLDVSAYIDGRDQLIIQGNTLQWDHFDFAAPGRLDGVNEPTIITTTLNGVTQMNGVDWIPIWPLPPPDPIRFPTLSSVFTGLTPSIPDTTDVTLKVINARDSMTIAQLPTASNNFTTLLEFNDDPSAGAAWYEGLLTFDSAAYGGGIASTGTLTVVNSTIADNTVVSGGSGGGLGVGGSTATVDNTIVALNTDGTGNGVAPDDISGTVSASSAYNLIDTGGAGGLVNGVDGNQVGVANPVLGALGDYGGHTPTIPLLPDSPAIDAGSDNIPGLWVPTTDQRGVYRPSARIDIGAFQDRGFQLTMVAGSSPQRTAVNTAFPHPLAITVTSPYGDPVAGGLITFVVTPSAGGASATLSASTATIAADGQASVTATANGTVGGYTVTASAAGAKPSVHFRLKNLPGEAGAGSAGTAASPTAAVGAIPIPADSGTDPYWLGIRPESLTDGQAAELAASLLTPSRAIGTNESPTAVVLGIGTGGRRSQSSGRASGAPSQRTAPRAEIRLAIGGRGWSLGTNSRPIAWRTGSLYLR